MATHVGSAVSTGGTSGSPATINVSGLGLQPGDVVTVAVMRANPGSGPNGNNSDDYSQRTSDALAGLPGSFVVYDQIMGSSPDTLITVPNAEGEGGDTVSAVAFASRGVTLSGVQQAVSFGSTLGASPNPPNIDAPAGITYAFGAIDQSDAAPGTISSFSTPVTKNLSGGSVTGCYALVDPAASVNPGTFSSFPCDENWGAATVGYADLPADDPNGLFMVF